MDSTINVTSKTILFQSKINWIRMLISNLKVSTLKQIISVLKGVKSSKFYKIHRLRVNCGKPYLLLYTQ